MTPNKPNKLSEVLVQRTDSEIGKGTEMLISFLTFNKVPQEAIVELKIPKDQVTEQSLKIYDGAKEIKAIKNSENSDFIILEIS